MSLFNSVRVPCTCFIAMAFAEVSCAHVVFDDGDRYRSESLLLNVPRLELFNELRCREF